MREVPLDSIDRELLTLIQTNSRRSVQELGAAVGMSGSAAHRRIQRMRAQRIIMREIAVIDPTAVGRTMVMIVSLSVDREGRDHLQALRSWLNTEPAVEQAWYVTGDADFIIVVNARSMGDFDEIMQNLVASNTNVRDFHTAVAVSTVKRGLSIKTGDGHEPATGADSAEVPSFHA